MDSVKFKVGDKVKYLMKDKHGSKSRVGKTGVVKEITTGGLSAEVHWEDGEVRKHCVDYLELVQEEKQKVKFRTGQKVKIISMRATIASSCGMAPYANVGDTAEVVLEDDDGDFLLYAVDTKQVWQRGYYFKAEDLEAVPETTQSQTLESIIAEQHSLSDQIKKLEERLNRKKKYYQDNAAEITKRIQGAI